MWLVVAKVRIERFRLVTEHCHYNERVHPHLPSLTWMTHVAMHFSSLRVVSRAFSALCVYSTFGHYPHLPCYCCAKFRFFRCPHCWASPWKKSHTHPLNHPAYLMPQELKLSLWNNTNSKNGNKNRHACSVTAAAVTGTGTITLITNVDMRQSPTVVRVKLSTCLNPTEPCRLRPVYNSRPEAFRVQPRATFRVSLSNENRKKTER